MAEANKKDRVDWKSVLGTIIVVSGFLWAAHHEFNTIDERIAALDKHISRVETAVRIVGAKQGGDTKSLIDEALTVAKNAADEGNTEGAQKVLNIANHLLAEQIDSKSSASQEFFDTTIQKYQGLKKSPALSDSAWSGATTLAEYRSATSSVPIGFNGVSIGELSQRGRYRYLKDSLVSGSNAIAIGSEKGFVLDGFYLENVVFENTTIIYNGGPAVLQNVRFVNCKFAVKRSLRSEQFLEAATKESVNVALG